MRTIFRMISFYPFLFIGILSALTFYFYGEEVRRMVLVVGYSISFLILLFTLIGAYFALFILNERVKMYRADRIEREKNAHIFTVQNGEQIFIRDTDPNATWRAAHLQRSLYSNGHYERPSIEEQRAWEAFIESKAKRGITQKLLEGEVMQQPTNLMSELRNEHRVLLVGASNAGKTTLLKHIVNDRLSTSQVIVIDPHASPNKWPGCQVVGIGRDYEQIEYTLDSLVSLMVERYQDIGRGEVSEEGHNRITIVIDEWRAIAQHTPNASNAISTLLTESRKAAFSVFVACHSERVKALGIEGEGDLRDGFVMVRLSWDNGQRVSTIDRGNGEAQAILPGEFTRFDLPMALPAKAFCVPDGPPPPSDIEAKILAMADNGSSISAIATEVLGSKGGPQNKQIKDILDKYNKGVKV